MRLSYFADEKMAAWVGAGAVNGDGLKSGQKATSVSVDDSETWVESKRYTVYKVVVRKADKAYFVFRRCVLRMCILTCLRKLGAVEAPKLPWERLFVVPALSVY